jgi:alanine racemase
MSSALGHELGTQPDRHILNTSGIERFPEAQFQMVRLGIGLHGIGLGESLVPASIYKTVISQIRTVKKGESIGYSRKAVAPEEMQVATIPVGYADGIDRRLGNGKVQFWLEGHRVPTTGNICMDMTMLDVSGTGAIEGDEVELFGRNVKVTELARQVGTIPYEILTGIPERVTRVYLHES